MKECRRSPHTEVMTGKSQTRQITLRDLGEEGFAAFVFEPKFQKGAAVAQHKAADRCITLRSCSMAVRLNVVNQCKKTCIHRSLLVSISPNSSRLPPLLEVAAEVAEPAAETVEKEEDGLLARTCTVGLS